MQRKRTESEKNRRESANVRALENNDGILLQTATHEKKPAMKAHTVAVNIAAHGSIKNIAKMQKKTKQQQTVKALSCNGKNSKNQQEFLV